MTERNKGGEESAALESTNAMTHPESNKAAFISGKRCREIISSKPKWFNTWIVTIKSSQRQKAALLVPSW